MKDDPKSTEVSPNEQGQVVTEIPQEQGQVTTEIPQEHGQYVEAPGHYYVYEDDCYDYGYAYRPYVDLDDYSSYHWVPTPYHSW